MYIAITSGLATTPFHPPHERQAGVELGLTQAETVSLELGLIRTELENIIWSQKIMFWVELACKISAS